MTPLEILALGAMMAAITLICWGDPWRVGIVIVATVLCIAAKEQLA